MNCEQAQNLYDAHLDGELPPSLETEFGTHQLQCPECRRAIALLEVARHVITTDVDPSPGLSSDFSDRLLACLGRPVRGHWWTNRRLTYFVGPLAAAAVLAFAIFGPVKLIRETKVLGKHEVGLKKPISIPPTSGLDNIDRVLDIPNALPKSGAENVAGDAAREKSAKVGKAASLVPDVDKDGKTYPPSTANGDNAGQDTEETDAPKDGQ